MYKLEENDSFYYNWSTYYFKHQDYIVAINNPYHLDKMTINTFNVVHKTFTSTTPLTLVNYNELEHVDYLYDYTTKCIAIDVTNKRLAKTTKMPYMISEIDGNYITIGKKGDLFYIFHSHLLV